MDQFKNAVIGFEHGTGIYVYSMEKMIDILIKSNVVENILTVDEAIDYLSFNYWNVFDKDNKSIFVNDIHDFDIDDL